MSRLGVAGEKVQIGLDQDLVVGKFVETQRRTGELPK
jgi:hypothetical protein